MRYASVFLFVLVFASWVGRAEAATFAAYSQFYGCEDFKSLSTPLSADCGTVSLGALEAKATASAGGGSTSAFASSISSRDTSGLGFFTGYANSFAVVIDQITATWIDSGELLTSGSASFSLDLLGSLDSVGEGSSAVARSNFSVNGVQLFGYDSVTDGAPDMLTSVMSSIALTGITTINAYAFAEAQACLIVAGGETCYAASDLGSTLRITGLRFFDDSGVDITSLLNVTSDSGFDYVAGAPSHDRGSQGGVGVVPLPANLTFYLTALFAMVSYRGGRRRLPFRRS